MTADREGAGEAVRGQEETPGLIDLAQIPEVAEASAGRDASSNEEKRTLDFEDSLDDKLAKERIEGRKQDREERKKYASRIFVLICCWLGGLFLVLLVAGWGESLRFSLDFKVLLALIGGTTLNVLGIFAIVARYLFSRPGGAE